LLSEGALSVNASSTINLMADATRGDLTFSSAARTAGVLNVNQWTGQANTGGTDDRVFITTQPSATFLKFTSRAVHLPVASR
jgi:hypothetical protein